MTNLQIHELKKMLEANPDDLNPAILKVIEERAVLLAIVSHYAMKRLSAVDYATVVDDICGETKL